MLLGNRVLMHQVKMRTGMNSHYIWLRAFKKGKCASMLHTHACMDGVMTTQKLSDESINQEMPETVSNHHKNGETRDNYSSPLSRGSYAASTLMVDCWAWEHNRKMTGFCDLPLLCNYLILHSWKTNTEHWLWTSWTFRAVQSLRTTLLFHCHTDAAPDSGG